MNDEDERDKEGEEQRPEPAVFGAEEQRHDDNLVISLENPRTDVLS